MNGRNIHIPEFIYNHTFYDEAGLTEESAYMQAFRDIAKHIEENYLRE
jgi:hypothetical protein